MKVYISDSVDKELKRIKKRDKKLTKTIEKQLILFKENPKHPSLRIHKLSGAMHNIWSLSITMNIRMIYILSGKDAAFFVKLGKHEDVYEK